MRKLLSTALALMMVLVLSLPAFAAEQYPMKFKNPIMGDPGREISIKKKPEKVLTFGPNCTELFVVLGLSDLVIGNSLNNHSRGPLPEFAEEYKKIPELNYAEATREAVLTSGADFIYGIDWQFGNSDQNVLDVNELESFGITAYVASATTMDAIYNEISDLGKIFGITDKTDAFIADQKNRIKTVQDKISDKKPLKVLVYDSGSSGVFTCSGSSFESKLITLAGGENLFNDLKDKAYVTVSYEEVLARNPDIILIHDYDSPSVEAKIEEIKANSTLSQMDAVKNNRFARIELETVLPGNRMAHSVEKLAQDFHPELFK